MSKTGISAQIDNSAESSGIIERTKDNTFIVIRCLESHVDDLLAYAPDLEKKYPSFEMAEEILSEKRLLPEGTILIRLLFSDALREWRGGRLNRLIADISDIIHVNKGTIRLVRVKRGSIMIVLRLPESAAQILLKQSSRREMLKAKFPTLETIEPIADSAPPSQSVSVAHALSTDSCHVIPYMGSLQTCAILHQAQIQELKTENKELRKVRTNV